MPDNCVKSSFTNTSLASMHSGSMRAIWSGSIAFGLVNIPVRLYSASRERALSFRLLDKEDHCPISYKKVCRDDDKVVHQKDIVKGYEYEKGQYVVLEPGDFKKAAPEKSEAIDIEQFVDIREVDPVYFDKPYYVEPETKAAKAYALLRDALKQSGKAAIARFVMRDKEHIALIRPYGDLLLLEQMRFEDELRDPEEVAAPSKAYAKKEMDLALSLVENMTSKFDSKKYKDTFTNELMKIIEAKAKGKRVVVAKGETPVATSTADILKALEASLRDEPQPLPRHGTRPVRERKIKDLYGDEKISNGARRVQKKKKLQKNSRTRR